VVPWNATLADATLVLQRKLAELANEEIEELVPVYPHVVAGQAFEQIVELARAYFCELIIISTHGRTGVSRALIGSVAERVVRHAHCPVLVVRQANMILSDAKTLNDWKRSKPSKGKI